MQKIKNKPTNRNKIIYITLIVLMIFIIFGTVLLYFLKKNKNNNKFIEINSLISKNTLLNEIYGNIRVNNLIDKVEYNFENIYLYSAILDNKYKTNILIKKIITSKKNYYDINSVYFIKNEINKISDCFDLKNYKLNKDVLDNNFKYQTISNNLNITMKNDFHDLKFNESLEIETGKFVKNIILFIRDEFNIENLKYNEKNIPYIIKTDKTIYDVKIKIITIKKEDILSILKQNSKKHNLNNIKLSISYIPDFKKIYNISTVSYDEYKKNDSNKTVVYNDNNFFIIENNFYTYNIVNLLDYKPLEVKKIKCKLSYNLPDNFTILKPYFKANTYKINNFKTNTNLKPIYKDGINSNTIYFENTNVPIIIGKFKIKTIKFKNLNIDIYFTEKFYKNNYNDAKKLLSMIDNHLLNYLNFIYNKFDINIADYYNKVSILILPYTFSLYGSSNRGGIAFIPYWNVNTINKIEKLKVVFLFNILHEFTHVIFGNKLSFNNNGINTFFAEGFTFTFGCFFDMFVDNDYTKGTIEAIKKINNNSSIPVISTALISNMYDKFNTFYVKSSIFIRLLLKIFGNLNFNNFVKELILLSNNKSLSEEQLYSLLMKYFVKSLKESGCNDDKILLNCINFSKLFFDFLHTDKINLNKYNISPYFVDDYVNQVIFN